jgi:hypothetical protein
VVLPAHQNGAVGGAIYVSSGLITLIISFHRFKRKGKNVFLLKGSFPDLTTLPSHKGPEEVIFHRKVPRFGVHDRVVHDIMVVFVF